VFFRKKEFKPHITLRYKGICAKMHITAYTFASSVKEFPKDLNYPKHRQAGGLKMNKLRILAALIFSLLTVLPVQNCIAGDMPINLLPMYGAPEVVKTDEQKKSDEVFIETATQSCGSRQKAAVVIFYEGGRYLSEGDLDNAMRRFNQSWLLDPENYMSYWGYGKIFMKKLMMEKSIGYFERSLLLIDLNPIADLAQNKPLLLTDVAIAYSIASIIDKSKAADYREKSYNLFQKAIQLYPDFLPAYKVSIDFYILNKEYAKAWDVVHKARKAGIQDLPEKRLNELAEKMPELQQRKIP
jgi:tetratricopeptide (TPR) repeat protein